MRIAGLKDNPTRSRANFYKEDLRMWKEDDQEIAFRGQIFSLPNVCFSSLCEAGTITRNTSKLFCAPQLGARFREALYTSPILHQIQGPLSTTIKKLCILPHLWLESIAK